MYTKDATQSLDTKFEYSAFENRALRGLDLRPGGQLCASNADRLVDYLRSLDLAAFFRTFSDADVAEMTLPRAYWHPGGFIRSQLFCGSRDLPEVRLHYWKSNDLLQFDEAIHEHPWDAVSVALQGSVQNEFWRIGEGDTCPIVYFETKDTLSAAYTQMGTCAPALTSSFDISQGQYYWIPSGVFHRTKLLSEEAITLFVRGPFLRTFSLIADQNGPAQYSSVKTEVSVNALAELSRSLRQFIHHDGLSLMSEARPDDATGRV